MLVHICVEGPNKSVRVIVAASSLITGGPEADSCINVALN